jgi:hypothetical protein
VIPSFLAFRIEVLHTSHISKSFEQRFWLDVSAAELRYWSCQGAWTVPVDESTLILGWRKSQELEHALAISFNA